MTNTKKFAASAVLALSFGNMAALDRGKVDVTVVETLPSNSFYTWQVAGYGSVSCSQSTCSSYYMPSQTGTSLVSGAVLKLRFSDGSIVVAGCTAKSDVALNILAGVTAGLGGPPRSAAYRDCRVPGNLYKVEAAYAGSSVKVWMTSPALYGKITTTSETYNVLGVLRPAGTPEASRPVDLLEAFDPQCSHGPLSDTLASGCQDLRIAKQYFYGERGAGTKDPKVAEQKALPWFQRAAKDGSVVAQNYLKQKAGMYVEPAQSPLAISSTNTSTPEIPSKKSLVTPASYSPSKDQEEHRVKCFIYVVPMEALVDVDGKRVGAAPAVVEWNGIAGQEHTIKIQMDGWISVEKKVTDEGHNMKVNINLRPKSDL